MGPTCCPRHQYETTYLAALLSISKESISYLHLGESLKSHLTFFFNSVSGKLKLVRQTNIEVHNPFVSNVILSCWKVHIYLEDLSNTFCLLKVFESPIVLWTYLCCYVDVSFVTAHRHSVEGEGRFEASLQTHLRRTLKLDVLSTQGSCN